MPRVRNGLFRPKVKLRPHLRSRAACRPTCGRAVDPLRAASELEKTPLFKRTAVDKPFEGETIGTLIVVRFRAEPTEQALEACQDEVLALSSQTGLTGVIYDLRQIGIPPSKVMLHQRTIDLRTGPTSLTRRIVVPNLFIGHLARMAFSGGSCTIFYDDFEAAKRLMLGPPERFSWSMREERRLRERRVTKGRRTAGRRSPPSQFPA